MTSDGKKSRKGIFKESAFTSQVTSLRLTLLTVLYGKTLLSQTMSNNNSVVLNYVIISFACVFFMWTWRYSHQPTLIPQPISQVFLPTGLNESRMSDDWLHSNPQSEINAYVLKWYIPLSWMNIMGSYDYCYWLSFIADLKCLKDTAACAFDCTNNLFSIFFLC